jgi:NAD(P)H-nitrite reductase large subunit
MSGRLPRVKNAVVIGGGLIGVSVSEALTKRGVGVTILERNDRILKSVLDQEGSMIAMNALSAAGVTILTNRTAKEIVAKAPPSRMVGGVVLGSGESMPCDLVVVAIGVVPRVNAVKCSSVEIKRGVVVDRQMRTNFPDLYAAGDAAEAYDYVLDANRPVPIWPGAFMGGRIAGFNMAGKKREYEGITPMNSLKYFGLAIVSAGKVVADGETDMESHSDFDPGAGVYRRVLLKNGVIEGLVMIGEIDTAGVLYGLMRERVPVERFKDKLLSPDFGLVGLPRDVRQTRLVKATA